MVDPYEWLAIPKDVRPPNHYQLLGLDPAVVDTQAIRAAADRQLRRLMPHVTGPEALAAEQLWTELEEARDTLLDADRRASYDATIPLTQSNETPQLVAATEQSAPDISAFEEPPLESAPAGAVPWWQAGAEPAPTPANQWWEQPLPEEPADPPPPAPVAATHSHTATMPLPMATFSSRPVAAPSAHSALPDPMLMPRQRRSQTSTIAVAFAALFVVGMIAGGAYYAFGARLTRPPE